MVDGAVDSFVSVEEVAFVVGEAAVEFETAIGIGTHYDNRLMGFEQYLIGWWRRRVHLAAEYRVHSVIASNHTNALSWSSAKRLSPAAAGICMELAWLLLRELPCQMDER